MAKQAKAKRKYTKRAAKWFPKAKAPKGDSGQKVFKAGRRRRTTDREGNIVDVQSSSSPGRRRWGKAGGSFPVPHKPDDAVARDQSGAHAAFLVAQEQGLLLRDETRAAFERAAMVNEVARRRAVQGDPYKRKLDEIAARLNELRTKTPERFLRIEEP